MDNLISEEKELYLTLKKLYDIKHIEKELGIALETLYNCFKSGVYYKYKRKIVHCKMRLDYDLNLYIILEIEERRYKCITVKPQDYGKKYALTENELERK